MKSFQSPSPAVCLEKCKNNKLCNWYSYAEEFKLCMLLEDCRNLDENQPKFESGQKDCPLPFPAGENFKIFRISEVILVKGHGIAHLKDLILKLKRKAMA